MAEQMSTPGSTADASVNGGKVGASKDKACPFCSQQFTSSSLGRHLDLYIKERNPKPSDGVHHVEEIRKLRGGITRRQPRNSTSRRDDSTPARTPSAQDRRSPRPDSASGNRSPSARRDDRPVDRPGPLSKPSFSLNRPTWEATGVMNVIPQMRNGDSRGWDTEDRDGPKKPENRNKSVSKQILAKTTFEQKQKMIEALDNAKAAELAMRELLGSIRAAKQRVEGPTIFNYDPLALDFPSLCLHCLPPPPTIYQTIPLPAASSWSISPPSDSQYQALRLYFSSEFRRWRNSCAMATTAQQDDLSYPPPADGMFESANKSAELARQTEVSVSELESQISEHLHSAFAHWTSLSSQKRQEIWILEMARSIGRKSDEIVKLKQEKEFSEQETAHLKIQVDELSRLQHPREFKLLSPTTIPISREMMNNLGETDECRKLIGFDPMGRHAHLDTVIQRAIERWKRVVKEARGNGNGLTSQRSLSGESAHPSSSSGPPAPPAPLQTQTQSRTAPAPPRNPIQTPTPVSNHIPSPVQTNGLSDDMCSDADADADADMDDDDSYMEMNEAQTRAPEAPMAATKFRLTNGHSGQASPNERAIEVKGYVRIGA